MEAEHLNTFLLMFSLLNVFSIVIFFASLFLIISGFVKPIIDPIKKQVDNHIPTQIKEIGVRIERLEKSFVEVVNILEDMRSKKK